MSVAPPRSAFAARHDATASTGDQRSASAGGSGVRDAPEVDRHGASGHDDPANARIADPALQDRVRDRSPVIELGHTGGGACDCFEIGDDYQLRSTVRSTDRDSRGCIVRTIAVAISGCTRPTGHFNQGRSVPLGRAAVGLLIAGAHGVGLVPELVGGCLELGAELGSIFERELAVEANGPASIDETCNSLVRSDPGSGPFSSFNSSHRVTRRSKSSASNSLR